MNITKSVAVLVSLGLLVIAGFALTNLMLTCQPTTSAIEPTPQTLQSTAQTLPLGPKVTSVNSSIPGAHVLSARFVGGAYRMGVNLGSQEIGGPGDFMQNMLDNPGFEPPTDGHLIKVGSGATTSTFSDTTDSGAPTGYWIGAKASVRTGAAAGGQFTITAFTAAGSYTFGSCLNATGRSISCPTLAPGVGVIEVRTSTSIGQPFTTCCIANWVAGDSNSNLTTADKYEGQGSLAMNVADGNSHYVDYGWDTGQNTGGVCSNDNVTPCTIANQNTDCGSGNICLNGPASGPWHPVVGAFEIAFYAKGANTPTGTPQITVALTRTGGVNATHTFTLTNDGAWHHYTYTFTGTDTGFIGGFKLPRLDFKMTATNGSAEAGATIYVDDVYVGRQATSTTGFRNEVITSLQAINPGSLRYGAYDQLGTNDAGYEGASGCTAGNSGPTTTGTCDYLHGPAYINGLSSSWTYAAQDVYPLANALGAVPWMTIGNAMNNADLIAFTDRMCSAITTYGFPSVWIEQSNEEWNNGADHISYGSSNLDQLGYGEETQRNFAIMSAEATAHCPSVASRFHYMMGNQVCNTGVVSGEMSGAAAAGYPMPNTSQYGTDNAPYYFVNTAKSGSLEAQAAAYALAYFSAVPAVVGPSGKGCIATGNNDLATIGSNNFLNFYEEGPSSAGGPATTEQYYLSEGGYPSAAWMAQSWLQGQQLQRVPIQNEYQFTQAEYGYNGSLAPIWGIVHDLDSDFGPTFPHLRPIALGMEVVNSAIGGSYHPVDGIPSGTYASAFLQGTDWSAVLVNSTSTNAAGTITFPPGTVPGSCKTVHYSNGIRDNNENSNSVDVGSCTSFSCSGQTCKYNLPPFSVEAMDASSTATSMPHELSTARGNNE